MFQIFYFSLFCLVFGPSVAVNYLTSSLRTLQRYWYLIVPLIVLIAFIVYKNTIVHPYLLADNRHYTFYVWNKFYGKYWWARYAVIPLYLFSIIIFYQSIFNKSAGFKFMFSLCTVISIALQQLIEIRYFIIPFMILRLNMASVKFRWLLVELICYFCINAIVFYLFATKEIFWTNYDHIQRLIW